MASGLRVRNGDTPQRHDVPGERRNDPLDLLLSPSTIWGWLARDRPSYTAKDGDWLGAMCRNNVSHAPLSSYKAIAYEVGH